MVRCARCGTGYGMEAATREECPRCRAKDGVAAPLEWQLRRRGRDAERRALAYAQSYLAKTGGIDPARAAAAPPREV